MSIRSVQDTVGITSKLFKRCHGFVIGFDICTSEPSIAQLLLSEQFHLTPEAPGFIRGESVTFLSARSSDRKMSVAKHVLGCAWLQPQFHSDQLL